MTAEERKYKNTIAVIAAVMLLLAIPSIWPYGYYQLLRWVVAGSAAFIAYLAYNIGKISWMWILIVIGILFNPIVPFYLDKEVWVIIDLVAAVTFFLSISKIKQT